MALVLPVEAAAVPRQLGQMALLTQAATEEMAQHRPFLEAVLPMLAAAVVVAAQDQPAVLVAAALAAEQVSLAQQARLIPAAALEAVVLTTLLEIPAAPAS
jgi:nitrogen fixation/metabolism regulation signal transduction histidine kinase